MWRAWLRGFPFFLRRAGRPAEGLVVVLVVVVVVYVGVKEDTKTSASSAGPRSQGLAGIVSIVSLPHFVFPHSFSFWALERRSRLLAVPFFSNGRPG